MLEHRTDDREVLCSNPGGVASILCQFCLLHVAQVSQDAAGISEKDGLGVDSRRGLFE